MLAQAKDALTQLAQVSVAPSAAAVNNRASDAGCTEDDAPPSVDFSAWAAECDRLRDGLGVAEAKLAAERKARAVADEQLAAMVASLDEARREKATVEEQLEEIKQELEGAKEKIEDQEFAMEVDQEEITRLKDRDRKRFKEFKDHVNH